MELRIIIYDWSDEEIYGILTVTGHTEEEVWRSFDDTKSEQEGYWDLDSLLQGLRDKGWEFDWDTNFTTLAI